MGMDASARIWVGLTEEEFNELEAKVGPIVSGTDEYTLREQEEWDDDLETYRGMVYVGSGEDLKGWGYEIAQDDWRDSEPSEINLEELKKKAAKATTKLNAFLKKHGCSDLKPKIYLTADFS